MNRRKREWLKRLKAMPVDTDPACNSASGAKGLVIAPFGLTANMEAFDKLPRALRQAMRESAYNWSGAQVREKMAAGWTVDDLIKLIGKMDEFELLLGRRKALQEINRGPS